MDFQKLLIEFAFVLYFIELSVADFPLWVDYEQTIGTEMQAGLKKVSQPDKQRGLALHQMLTEEEDKWKSFAVPKSFVDLNFVRGLTAFVVEASGDYKPKDEVAYVRRFHDVVVKPCKQIVKRLEPPISRAEEHGVDIPVRLRNWLVTERFCAKANVASNQLAKVSYKVAEMNNLL